MVTAELIRQGKVLAEAAGRAEYAKWGGDRGACGFAWVEVYVDRTNSK